MNRKADAVLGAIALILVIAFMTYCGRVYATCDGAVVKNVFDWPVCVAGGNKR